MPIQLTREQISNTGTVKARFFGPVVKPDSIDDRIRQEVRSLLTAHRPWHGFERRQDARYPYPRLLVVTPLDEECEGCHSPLTVVGKNLSLRGVDFFHSAPLPYRRVRAEFERHDGTTAAFLLDLSWCRFTRRGWYISGGRFLDVLDAEQMVSALAPALERNSA